MQREGDVDEVEREEDARKTGAPIGLVRRYHPRDANTPAACSAILQRRVLAGPRYLEKPEGEIARGGKWSVESLEGGRKGEGVSRR